MARIFGPVRQGWRPAAMLTLAVMLAAPIGAQAQEAEGSTGEAERLVGEGFAKMLDALNLLLKTVPQYAAPEVQPNGDIIIRRLNPERDETPATPEADEKGGDSTET